jgi:hypothetical protein
MMSVGLVDSVDKERQKFTKAALAIYNEAANSYLGNGEPDIAYWLAYHCAHKPYFSGPEQVAYIPEGKDETVTPTKTTIRKFIGRQYKKYSGREVSETVLAWFHTKFEEAFKDVRYFEVKGPDIETVYRVHIGAASCMSGSNSAKTRLYSLNPDNIRMIVGTKLPLGSTLEEMGATKQMLRLLFFFPEGQPDTIIIDRSAYCSGSFSDYRGSSKDRAIEKIKELYPNIKKFRDVAPTDRLKVFPPDNKLWPHPDSWEHCSPTPDADGKYTLAKSKHEDTPFPLLSTTGEGPTCESQYSKTMLKSIMDKAATK